MRALSWVIATVVLAASAPAFAQPAPGPAPTASAQPPPGELPPAQPPPAQPPPAQPPPAQPPPAQPPFAPPPGQVAPNEVPGAWVPAPSQYGPGGPPYPPQGAPPPGGHAYPGYPPQGPPPPPLPPKEPSCCRFAVRFDPFDLIFRRLSFQAELVIWGPLSIEAEPSWIFGSMTENLDISGGSLQGNFLVYFTGRGLNGFFAKATVGFEKFTATLTDPELVPAQRAQKDLASPLLGVGIGSSNVFGDTFGFNLAGGVGIGFTTAEKQELTAGRFQATFYDKASSIQLLASLGLGFAF